MEITFSRVCYYSFSLDEGDKKKLAKHIGISAKKLDKLVDEGELLDEHWDEVELWVRTHPTEPDLTDQDGVEDLEVHAG